MTLPTSGSISLSQVNVELGNASSAQISLNDSGVRLIAGVASGQITLPTDFYGKAYPKYGGQSITYSIGSGGYGGTDIANGGVGGATTATFSGFTLTANGGERGYYENGAANGGGGATGGSANSTGGAGLGGVGDVGGGGGGGINGSNAPARTPSGGYGGNGASAIDFQGLSAALSGTGYSLGTGGSGADNTSTISNQKNGSPGTGIGAGGGGAGYFGGSGGSGSYGGGGGGAAGFSEANMSGGQGGQGVVVVRSSNGSTYTSVVLTSGTSYTLPSNAATVEIWAIGGGGGGGGASAVDPSSSGGGGAGGIAYRSWT